MIYHLLIAVAGIAGGLVLWIGTQYLSGGQGEESAGDDACEAAQAACGGCAHGGHCGLKPG